MNNSYFDIDYQIANTSFGHLFHDVQMSGIFSDSKTFPDCTPKADILAISNKYLEQKTDEKFDLKNFVLQNFELPLIPQNNFQADTKNTLSQHIFNIWPYLTVQKSSIQGTYIPLPKPFVVPGGRFQEVYYWDSFFYEFGLINT